MVNECMLTTFDNPFNPFEQFIQWFMYDIEKQYYSCSRLARVAQYFDGMTQVEEDVDMERAIDEIIMYDDANLYMKVYKQAAATPDERT